MDSVALDEYRILSCLGLEIFGEPSGGLAVGLGVEARDIVVSEGSCASIGDIAWLIEPVGGEPHFKASVARRLHEEQEIAAPVTGDHSIRIGFLDLGNVGGEILDFVNVVD